MDPNTKNKISIAVGGALAIAYILFPMDIVPDGLPIIGWIDDTIAVLAAVANGIRLAMKMRQ
ncbi:MAG TPA: hypothetical protein DEO38_02890 [Bacteroidales bacterium]|nr:hypothetical protein [Bacteroidales bacterium]